MYSLHLTPKIYRLRKLLCNFSCIGFVSFLIFFCLPFDMVLGLTILFGGAIVYRVLDSPATFEITNRSSALQNLAMADTLSGPLDPPIKGGKCSKTSILFHELFLFNPFVILASMFGARARAHIHSYSTKPELFHVLGNKMRRIFSAFNLSISLLYSQLKMEF